jgi:photosystem II stability/assembly factor-like uncharacterized protein
MGMKRTCIALALLSLIPLLVQCTSAIVNPAPTATQVKPAATATPISPTSTIPPTNTPSPVPTALPTTKVSFDPWELLRQTKASGPVYLAGFHDPDFGITVGYAGDVRYTADGGYLWTRAENKSACRFGLDIVDENTAWHCGNGGHIRVSTDGGQTWQIATSFGPNHPNHCRFLSFLDAKTGWAATPYQLGVTMDGAETWTEISLPEGTQTIAAISLRTVTEGYVLDDTSTLFITRDGGQTWSAYSLGTEDEGLLTASTPMAALRFTSANQGIAVFQDRRQVWYALTEDGGQTWQRGEIPMTIVRPSLYLAHDGETLTMLSGSEITVLRYER